MSADENLIDLMHRRAELLAALTSDGSTVNGSDDASSELEAVTDALRSGMSSEHPRIRSLSLDTDNELLTRLGRAEAINPLSDPDDPDELADRLTADRRCFVLEHPGLAGHPLNVVWVALTIGTPGSITAVLGSDRQRFEPAACDTAVFYSIWNVEAGLSGIPGGSALLGLAMDELGGEFAGLETFVTLSPIPGFRNWAASAGHSTEFLSDADRPGTNLSADAGRPTNHSAETRLPADDTRADMLRSCARYLTEMGPDGRLVDPVARFHMRNGARLWRINWAGDPSPTGLERSFGLMANYRYAPEDREANRGALADRNPAVGSQVADLLRDFPS